MEVMPLGDGGAPLVEAAAAGELEKVQELLAKRDADVNAQDAKKGDTALHAACAHGHVAVARWLLENGARLDMRNMEGDAVLHAAASGGDPVLVDLLMTSGFDNVDVHNQINRTPLHHAATVGALSAVKELLCWKAELEARDNENQRPVFRAALNGHKVATEFLLNEGADPFAVEDDGWSPLHAAAQSGDIETVKLLVERGADLSTRTKDETTALHIAAIHGSLDAAGYFLAKGLEVDALDDKKWTPLFGAALQGHERVVELLLHEGADVNIVTEDGWSPLHAAAQYGSVETIRLLLQRGADLHRLNKAGRSALHTAAGNGSEDAAQFLEAQGLKGDFGDINRVNEDGLTALIIAAAKNDEKAMELLIRVGANVLPATKDGWTVLHVAAQTGSAKMIKLLIQQGADVNATSKHGTSVLHNAASHGNEAASLALIHAGADMLAIDEDDGRSTFLHASSSGNVNLLKLCLDGGENVNAAAKDGKTALHIACSKGNTEAVKYLIRSSVDVNGTDENGRTALHYAAEAQGSGCVSAILNTEAKNSINLPDQDGYRALHLSAKAHFLQETKNLLDGGAEVHTITNTGESPLQLAVFGAAANETIPVVCALCSFGAEWTPKCHEKLMEVKAQVEAGEVDAAGERYQHLQWLTGLRTCILHWEQQHQEGSKQLTWIPIEVVQRGEASVKTYIADATSSNADDLVYRCKVCVVGPSEWGKSSLVRSMETMKPFLMDIRDRTIGIELVSTTLTGFVTTPADESDEDAGSIENSIAAKPRHHEVTFWDFAGQDVYQVAHSLFFSRRTLYVLVVDVNAYSEQLNSIETLRPAAAEAAMDRFLSRYLFRWVRTIFARQPDAEFLVVGTKADLLKDEEMDSARVWRDLQSRIYLWKLNYMREIEDEYGVVTKSSGKPTTRSAVVDEDNQGTRGGARIHELRDKLARLASDQWIVVSVTRRNSIECVRQALRSKIESSRRGFPMWTKYSRVLQAIAVMRAAANKPGNGQHRIEHGMMLFRPLSQRLMDEVKGLEYDECRAILQTLHDLGDIIWYENEEAGQLRDYIILDPMLVIDIVREVISHEHAKKSGVAVVDQAETKDHQPHIDGRVSHLLLETLPLWKHMDIEMMFAFKMLLQQFQLAYPADEGVMQPDSDIIVPSYWKVQFEAAATTASVATSLHPSTMEGVPSLANEAVSLTCRYCWEYEVSADLTDAIFEQFAVQSYTTFMNRTVRANCIESSCAEFQSKITLHTGTSKHDVIRVEVASADADIAWLNMRYYLMKLEKVLDAYSGLAVPRYVLVGGKRHSLSPAIKAIRDSILMGRTVNSLRQQMPWLPPDLDWFIHGSWRDIAAFQELQLMHLVRNKVDVLQKLVVKGDSQRRYPALWSLEYKMERHVVVLRLMSDLSGRCYHVPIEIDLPPAFLAKHGSKLKEGVSLLANVVSSSLSVPILQTAIDVAVSSLETKTQQATTIHNLIERLDLTTSSGDVIKSSVNSGLSPGGAMAVLRDLLKIHNDSLDEMSITEICNLECAATSKGDYVWAHTHEISMLKKELTPCQPRFVAVSPPRTPTSSEPESSTRSTSKLCLSLCIKTVTGLADWDWYKTYCTWQLFYGDTKTPLAAGATATSTDGNLPPSWRSLKMSLDVIESVEMLRQCRLVVHVKRRSRIGWTKFIGEGQVELRSLVSVDAKHAFFCDPIEMVLQGSRSSSTSRVVRCQIRPSN